MVRLGWPLSDAFALQATGRFTEDNTVLAASICPADLDSL
jgi:uncharacterized membrane protein